LPIVLRPYSTAFLALSQPFDLLEMLAVLAGLRAFF